MPNEWTSHQDRQIVAVGLLTSSEVALVGAQLSRLYPLEAGSPFDDLLDAIDKADQQARMKANVSGD